MLLSSSGEVISSKLGTVQEQDIRGWLNLAYAASDNLAYRCASHISLVLRATDVVVFGISARKRV